MQRNKPILKDKKSVFIDKCVRFGKNVIIYENNRIEGETFIDDNSIILPGNYIIDTKIGKNCQIDCSRIDKSVIGDDCSIGPFARLRPNSFLENEIKVGNFVEIKNSNVKSRTKISHLAYVGDADVGEDCNIGCGAIFVNYNGKLKSRTTIGDNCFIGSNCNVIAPVKIEDNVYVCAGTTVTNNVNNDDFVIGRVRQEVKEKRAHEYLKTFKGER